VLYHTCPRPLYVGSEIYRRSTYGPTHPLAIPRVTTCTDLCRAMGWLPDEVFVTAPMADLAAVTRFHAPDYVAALARAEERQSVSDADRERGARDPFGVGGRAQQRRRTARRHTERERRRLARRHRSMNDARSRPSTSSWMT